MTIDQGINEGKRWLSEINTAESALHSLLKAGKHAQIERDVEAPMYGLIKTWRDDYSMWPYTKCDTAARDLIVLSGAYSMRFSEKIIQAELSDYKHSKSACSDAVNKPLRQLETEILKEKLEIECVQKQIFDVGTGKLSPDSKWKKPKFCP